ncbi:MAG: hypothetical protein A2V67_04920 [Deltaproteobacteria bacterium RBG_13_61_14]|nr:MAG: hypothetical protein A2V67_04920 [Deltaproteobacteria bacterium RBG_13_61_14]
MESERTITPIVPLYDYQRAWIKDASRFKIGCWSRQCGKTFAATLEQTIDCRERPRSTWINLTRGERQCKQLMAQAKTHLQAQDLLLDWIEDRFKVETDEGDKEYLQLELRLPNGSRIIGLPANPDTARGYPANVYLDEFSIHKDSRQIWTAIYPSLTRGYKIRITSTPKGRQNKFYELFTANKKYSRHFIDIIGAVAQGLELKDEDGNPQTLEDLREGLADEEAWQQEYLCKFLDEATAFLTYELIGEAESDEAEDGKPLQGGRVYAGVDIGRKRDLTVFWAVEQLGDVFWTRRLMELERTPFSMQRDLIFGEIVKLNPVRVCLDATGLGMQLAEETVKKFGSRAEAVTFSAKVKEDLATTIRRRFEDKQVRIPIDNKIREDLHSVKKFVTSAGNTRFDSERNEDGHADRFWALALALHAGDRPPVQLAYQRVGEPRKSAELREYM